MCISIAAAAKTVEDRKAAQCEAALTALLTCRGLMLTHPMLLLAAEVPFHSFQLLNQQIVACPERVLDALPTVLTPPAALQLASLELYRDSFVAGGRTFDLANEDVLEPDTFVDELLAVTRKAVSDRVRAVQRQHKAATVRREQAGALQRRVEEHRLSDASCILRRLEVGEIDHISLGTSKLVQSPQRARWKT
jgi:hypothetical protein